MFVGGEVDHDKESTSKAVRGSADCLPRRETVQDLRANLARIEERSRRLLGASGGTGRVVRSVEALAETGRSEAATVARTAAQYGEGHSSADVFLAQLGFNAEEQFRLLRRIEATRPVPTAPLGGGGDASVSSSQPGAAGFQMGAAGGAGNITQMSVGAFLAAKRGAAVAALVNDAHAMTLERARDAAAQASATMWEARKHEIAESTGLRNLLNSTAGSHHHPHGSITAGGGSASSGGGNASASASSKLAVARRVAAFAGAVKAHPPSEWPHQFATVAAEVAATEGDDDSTQLAGLWTGLHRVLSFQRKAPGSPAAAAAAAAAGGSSSADSNDAVLRAVSASRCDLELRALGDLYSATHDGSRPPRADELRRMHVDVIKGMLDRHHDAETAGDGGGGSGGGLSTSSSDSAEWAKTFRAMACGRYDAAASLCPDAGVSDALRSVASTQPSARHAWSLKPDQTAHLQTLYDERVSREMPFRAAVLFVLLAGGIGRAEDSTEALQAIAVKAVATLDALLWLRLTLVRVVRNGDPSPTTGRAANPTQSLEEVQRQLLSQQQQLLQSAGSDVGVLADLLIHALLFNTAARLLGERAATAADGVHMAVMLHQHGMLNAPPGAESPTDLGALLQQHAVSLVSSGSADNGNAAGPAASAIFTYFAGTHQIDAFVDMCATTRGVAASLLGKAGGRRGPVLQSVSLGAEDGLVEAVFDIAEAAASRGGVDVAIDALVSLHDALTDPRGAGTAHRTASAQADASKAAIRAVARVLELLLPALSHRVLKALSGVMNDLVQLNSVVGAVRDAINKHAAHLPSDTVNAFEVLRYFAQTTVERADGNINGALETFFSLPFVPCGPDEADVAAKKYDAEFRTDVVAGVLPRMVSVVVDMIAETARDATTPARAQELRTVADTLVRWFSQVATAAQASDAAPELKRCLSRFPSGR